MESDVGQALDVPPVKGQVSGALKENEERGEPEAGRGGAPKPATTGLDGSTGETVAGDVESKQEA